MYNIVHTSRTTPIPKSGTRGIPSLELPSQPQQVSGASLLHPTEGIAQQGRSRCGPPSVGSWKSQGRSEHRDYLRGLTLSLAALLSQKKPRDVAGRISKH